MEGNLRIDNKKITFWPKVWGFSWSPEGSYRSFDFGGELSFSGVTLAFFISTDPLPLFIFAKLSPFLGEGTANGEFSASGAISNILKFELIMLNF